MVVLLAVTGYAGAGGAEKLYDGYCADDKPVVTKWDPVLDPVWRPVCFGNTLGLERDMEDPPDLEFRDEPDPPADWFTWATIRFNDRWMTNPYDDVIPYVTASTSRTMIPIRMVTEGMGGKAEWNEAERKVTIRLGERYMTMTIDKQEAEANGNVVRLDQTPLIWMDRTMVPLRVVVEAFGALVNWDGKVYRVDITLPGVECAPGYCLEW